MKRKFRQFTPPGLTYIADNIISKQNVLGASREIKASWAKDVKLKDNGETIFFAGCGYQYSSGFESMMSLIRSMDKSILGAELPMSLAGAQKKMGIDVAGVYRKFVAKDDDGSQPLRDAVNVLRKLGIDLAYLGMDEPCCGGILYYAGMEKDFSTNAKELHDKFISHGVKKIIGMVPSCTFTLRKLIPRYIDGYDIEVKHFLEVVAANIGSNDLSFPDNVVVTYHDPCQLSRYLEIIDEPRQILNAIKGIKLVEVKGSSKEWSTCCGGGGGFEAVFPELSEILAIRRTEELVDTGAQVIVTHCPGCIIQIKEGLKRLKKDNIQVLDLAQIIALSMGV